MNLLERIKQKILLKFGSTEKVFNEIYKEGSWGSEESVSGPGSTMSNTESIRKALPGIFKEYQVNSILDVPCGDFHWMSTLNLSKIRYIGGDIVNDLIERNKGKFTQENVEFRTLNLIEDTLPQVDLIISRDCFIHFSYKDTFKAVNNIKSSNSKYILLSTYPDVEENINIDTGQNYNVNLQKPPFNFDSPIALVDEVEQRGDKHGRKCMGLWLIESLPKFEV